MRASVIKSAVEGADAIVTARMELLLIELATTKREPTATERVFLEENVDLMREIAEEIAAYAQEKAKPSIGHA
jgi:hypothetical protein